MTESERPAKSAPSSSPPSGLRLVQPAAVPRPVGASTPPPPASMRAPALSLPPLSLRPPETLRAPTSSRPPPPARPTAASIAALTATLPPPPSGPRTSPPPRPAVMRLEELREEILEDEPEVLGDEDVTVVDEGTTSKPPSRRPPPLSVASLKKTGADWPLVDPSAASVASPMPPVPWTAESTPVPANAATPAPIAQAPAHIPAWPALATAPESESFTMTVPAPMRADDAEDDLLPPMSPAAVLRQRLVTAWESAPSRVRTAITFGAGFVAGAIAIAIV